MDSSTVLSKFCSNCALIFSDGRETNVLYPFTCQIWPYYEAGVLQIPDATARDCHLCSIITPKVAEIASGQISFTPTLPPFPNACGYSMQVQIQTENSLLNNSSCDQAEEIPPNSLSRTSELPANRLVFFIPSREQPVVRIKLRLPADPLHERHALWNKLESFTNSNTTWQICREWLERCDSTHNTCQALRPKQSWLPTRLLDVRVHVTSDEDCVRLQDQFSDDDDLKYAALSHCWGKSPTTKATQDSLEKLKKGIPVKKLPLTFQEAVAATRNLGLTHLWIDSLCIIQDSTADWLKESSLMSMVYRKSYVNLAATHSKDGTGGLFTRRDPLSVTPCVMKIQHKGCLPGIYYSLQDTQTHWASSIERKSPLKDRAWVFQERLLAIRTLHFDADKIYLECCQQRATEVFPNGDDVFEPREASGRGGKHDYNAMRLHWGTSLQNKGMEHFWAGLVTDYSHCKLTKSTDVLVAFSGLASEMGSMLGPSDRYLAGMWLSKLAHMLLWTPRDEIVISKEYLAPSWSWASFIGPVSTNDWWLSGTSLVTIIEATTSPVKDPYGQITSGYLRVRGYLLRGYIHSWEPVVNPKKKDDNPNAWIMEYGDRNRKTINETQPRRVLLLDCEQNLVINKVQLDRGSQATSNPSVFCFLLVSNAFFKEVRGLILESTGTKRGQFRRVGTFIMDCRGKADGGDFELQWEPLRDYCEEVFDDDTVTISII